MSLAGRRPHGRTSGSATSDVAQLFALAVRHHQAGQLTDAESFYRQVLALDQKHASALHNLGLIGIQVGRLDLGAEMIARAVAVNDRLPEWHYNLAFALVGLGRSTEAIAHYRKAIVLKPDYAEAHMNLGNAFKLAGQLDQATACYQEVIALQPGAMEAHYNIANVWAAQGAWEKAADAYERALALKPDFAEAHTHFGIVLNAQGKRTEAAARHRRALDLNPNLAEAYVNLGKLLESEGEREAAVEQYRQALARNPNHAQAHNNLGVVLMADGNVDAAIASYQRALALKPDLSEARNNLGILLLAKGQLDEATGCFQASLAAKPDFVEAYNNLARVAMAHRDAGQALRTLARALAVRETPETKALFVECLKNVRMISDASAYGELVTRALSEPWGRPSDVSHFAANLILQNPAIAAAVARAVAAWPRRLAFAELLDGETRAALARDRLLLALLSYGRITDVELERFLTVLRAALLGVVAGTSGPVLLEDAELDLFCALARQCFSNDYVFAADDAEMEQVDALRDRLVTALKSNADVPVLGLITVACYVPLCSLPLSPALLERSWPDAVTRLLQQQVREPQEEREQLASIERLTTIKDDVSLLVQEQYEQNPYPRWEKPAPAPEPTSVDDYLRRLFPLRAFRPLGKSHDVDVLIAGCGTGQHSIEIAQRWRGTRMLAIDLSRHSLSYARRQSLALGLDNITYAQADILELASLGRSFDVIEAAGVLHHLADPRAGWRVLTSLLRDGGFVFLGLYSEIARRDIVSVRDFIASRGYRATPADIRHCRQELMDAVDGSALKNVTLTSDFASASECRDLLFHVQEHRTTLPDIAAALAENGLTFLGFEIDAWAKRRYAVQFPDDPALANLDHWRAFENENPLTFVRMYQFWAQKA
jgi:tetratricopeptide (TPR) repeat protein/2-polyprenyl-3-methyl-5-hydroxy-6-metoxy-1,4-benzoquinol methylase